MSARIVVHRHRALWRDIARSYKILVDGRVVGKVRNGRAVAIDVAPGRHRVRVMIDWTGSPTADVLVESDASVHLEVRLAGTIFGIFWRAFTKYRWLGLRVLPEEPAQDDDWLFAG